MSSLSDAVKNAIKVMEQDRTTVNDAKAYLGTPIQPPPHLRSALHQDYQDYHYDFSSPDETDRRLVLNFKIAFLFSSAEHSTLGEGRAERQLTAGDRREARHTVNIPSFFYTRYNFASLLCSVQ